WAAVVRRTRENPCHCHGVAGAAELFLDLAQRGAGSLWRRRAESLTPRLGRLGLQGGAGLGRGTAGIVRQLLRLAGHEVFSILAPDRSRLRSVPGPRAGVRASGPAPRRLARPLASPSPSVAREIVPRAAVALAKRGRYVIVGTPGAAATHAILERLRHGPGGSVYYEALRRVETACARLAARPRELLAPNALSPAALGGLLRELAGLALAPSTEPRTFERAARVMTGN